MPAAKIAGFTRIIAARHAATPAGVGYGSSRFSSPTGAFRVLYAAGSFRTALAEAIIRDRLYERPRRDVSETMLEQAAVTLISSRRPLLALDLNGDNPYRLGLDTDAVRGRNHHPGQIFAEALVAQTQIDAIAYPSRLTGEQCIAIFDRALPDVTGTRARPLLTVAALAAELDHLSVRVVRRRARQPQPAPSSASSP